MSENHATRVDMLCLIALILALDSLERHLHPIANTAVVVAIILRALVVSFPIGRGMR